ncbi:MAG: galactokinase family protein [Acidobacteriota bacterium]
MYRIVYGSTKNLQDVTAFLELLNSLHTHQLESVRNLFSKDDILVTRAPGRLDVMGGIADYSGSLVLQLPIQEATLVALQKNELRQINIISLNAEANHRSSYFKMSLDDFADDGQPISYAKARDYFKRDISQHWAAYAAGAFLVLMRERDIRFTQGANILIESRVPEGKGVSSSAAIEVAVFKAIISAFDIAVSARDLALLCQKVENQVVGAPCGVMDQMTAACGEANQLLALRCQPAELNPSQKIPEAMAFWGMDSGIRHSVGAGDYGSVRTGAFMGYRIIAELAGFEVMPTAIAGQVNIKDEKWRGYLANITPAEYENNFATHLPVEISGQEFLSRYQGISDSVTQVYPDKIYAVRVPTAHPIYENARVQRFAQLLNQPVTDATLKAAGALMFASHASYSACGLGSEGTDLMVELVKTLGESRGLYGAKITGGGSGGTVAIVGRQNALAMVEQIADEYAKQTGHRPLIFSGSSMGTEAFNYLKLSDAP